jgi:hypothetical protein
MRQPPPGPISGGAPSRRHDVRFNYVVAARRRTARSAPGRRRPHTAAGSVGHAGTGDFTVKKALILAFLIPFVLGPSLPAAGQDDATDTIKKILTTRSLWGKDFAAGLAFLPAWTGGEERTVAIFPERIVAATPFKTAEAAQQKREAVARALTAPRPQTAPGFEELLQPFAAEGAPFETAVVQSQDDDTFRVVLTGPALEFLPQELTVQQVQEAAGLPESVTTQVIQGEGERRPIVLTLRSYAKGAIVYAESDWAPRPGFVDRVFLNVPDVTAVLFKGGQ